MISKNEKIIISKFSNIIKKEIINLVKKNKFLKEHIDIQNYCGACGIASFALYKILNQKNIDCKLIYGYHLDQEFNLGERHCWIEYQNQVIDVTYKQISNNNQLYVEPDKYVKITENPKHSVFNRYWSWQNPYRFKYNWNNSKLNIQIKGDNYGTST